MWDYIQSFYYLKTNLETVKTAHIGKIANGFIAKWDHVSLNKPAGFLQRQGYIESVSAR